MESLKPRPAWVAAQDWSKDQENTWKSIQEHWAHLVGGDTEKFLSYLHPHFTGFGHESPLLIDKESIRKWVGFWIKNTKIPVYELQPIYVSVHGNFAVVHYFIFTLEVSETKSERVIRRYTSTCVKEKNKWLIIGNHNEKIHGW